MANLQEVVSWEAGIYQLETGDPVLGGPGGVSNKQGQALANRTAYLKKHVDDIKGGNTAAGKADKLSTARNIALAGDVTGQTAFDGSGNITITATYKNSGVVAGTYRSVTVDAKGNITAGTNPTTLDGYGITDAATYLAAGSPLPAKNIGPIWHDDYGGWMQWQEFTSNGANYRGYASQNIGSLLLDTQPTPRAGYIKSGVQNLSRVTYAALRAWAMHNGLMVAPGVWTAGAIKCADNADGTTFRIYDVRAEFLRAFDDGRGVDAGRVFGSSQASANLSHVHIAEYAFSRKGSNPGGVIPPSSAYTKTYFDSIGEDGQLKKADNGTWGNGSVGLADLPSGGPEARPRNSALLAAIKY